MEVYEGSVIVFNLLQTNVRDILKCYEKIIESYLLTP